MLTRLYLWRQPSCLGAAVSAGPPGQDVLSPCSLSPGSGLGEGMETLPLARCSWLLSISARANMNSPGDINPRPGETKSCISVVPHPVYIEHMVLMLCTHKVDGRAGLSHTDSTHPPPFPNVPLGCDKKHRGLGPSQC